MSDATGNTCVSVVEVLIPGPQGPAGSGSGGGGLGPHPVVIANAAEGEVIAFSGAAWKNRPLPAAGDMAKAVYDADGDGKVDAAKVADGVAWGGVAGKPGTFPPSVHAHAIVDIDAEGEPSVLTFLRGDGRWASPPAGGGESGPVAWADILDVPAAFVPSAHVHAIADVTGLGDALAAKAPLVSPALTGTPTAPTAGPGTSTGQIATTAFVSAAVAGVDRSWNQVTGKPSTFPPSTHAHAVADVTGLADALAAKASKAVATQSADGLMAASDKGKLDGIASGATANAAASVADIRSGTDEVRLTPAKPLWDAHAPVALADAATIAMNMQAGINFTVTIAENRTLGNPANMRPGQSGWIRVTRDGAQTLSFASQWKGEADIPDSGAFLISYACTAATEIVFAIRGIP